MKNLLKVIAGIVLFVVVGLFINKFTTEPFVFNEAARDEQLVKFEQELMAVHDSKIALGLDLEYDIIHRLEKMVLKQTAHSNPVLAWFGISAGEPNWDAIKSEAKYQYALSKQLVPLRVQVAKKIKESKISKERKGELMITLYACIDEAVLEMIQSQKFEDAISKNEPLYFSLNGVNYVSIPDSIHNNGNELAMYTVMKSKHAIQVRDLLRSKASKYSLDEIMAGKLQIYNR